MKIYNKVTPDGTRDLLFEECESLRKVEAALRERFELCGYREVSSPGFEFYDVFSSNAPYFPPESMYKLIDNQGRIMVVRPDSTIPLARMVATKLKQVALPLRLYYAQRVYRQTPSFSGRRDETMQMGVELIGDSSLKSDIEILWMALSLLKSCSDKNCGIELGHIGIFKKLLRRLSEEFSNEEFGQEQTEEVYNAVLSKNYAQLKSILSNYPKSKSAAILTELPGLFGGEEALTEAKKLFTSFDTEIDDMLSYLSAVFEVLSELSKENNVMFDFGLVNQADYYSSLIFRGYVENVGEPVLSGGRYDNLLSDFGYETGATGFAVNVDKLSEIFMSVETPVNRERVLVFSDCSFIKEALRYQKTLTEKRIVSEYALCDSFDEALCYAKEKGYVKIAMVSDEIKESLVHG